MVLPTGLASLLLVLLAAVPPSSDAAPLPLPSSFDPLYLSIIPTASVINAPSEPPPRQATRSAEVNGMGGFAVAAVAASSSTPIAVQQVASTVIATVYESRIVTTTISMIKPSVESQVEQQQVIPSVASSSQIVALPTTSSPAPSTTLAPTSLPPPSLSIIVVTQTVTLPPPQPSSAVPLVDAAVQPSLAPSPLPLTRTDPQLTPVFPTTTWAQPATYSDLSSFKIKKCAVGKENFQVVQGIPAWASQGYVAPLPVATPPSSVPLTAPDAPAEEAPAPAPVTTETPGLLDGLLGALGRRGRASHPHRRFSSSSSHNHHLSLPIVQSSPNHHLQPLIARSPPTTLSSPAFAWDNLTSSAMQVLFPSGSANPSATPVGGGDFYATPYDFSSASNMTLEYSVFFPLGFDFVKGGKLPGLYGGKEGCSGGDSAEECWSSRMMWRKEGRGEIYLYVPKDKQTPRLCATPPQSVCDSTYGLSIGRGSFSFKTGGWTTVRQDIWMNTPGLNDGGFNIFIDGNFIFSANDVLYRNAPAPIVPPAPSDPTTSTPSSDDSSTLSKRYDDGFYHPSPSMDDGKYHPGVVGGQSVQSEEEDSSSVASATQQDVPQDSEAASTDEQTWEETEGQEHADEVKSPASYAEDQPSSSSSSNEEDQPSSSSNDDVVQESSPSPSPTEESAPPPPAWTPSDQEIPAPPPPSPIEAPSSSSDFTPSSSGGSSLATDDGDNEESSESDDQEEQTEQGVSSTSSSDNQPTTSNDDEEVSSESQQDETPSPPSPPSPPPSSEPSTSPAALPTISPTTSTQTSPSPSPSAEAIPPPPPPPTNDPEQSPSPEPVPTPGDNTDGPMLGFTGIFFSTFFGGHGADWASPSDQDVWFSGFSVRTNA